MRIQGIRTVYGLFLNQPSVHRSILNLQKPAGTRNSFKAQTINFSLNSLTKISNGISECYLRLYSLKTGNQPEILDRDSKLGLRDTYQSPSWRLAYPRHQCMRTKRFLLLFFVVDRNLGCNKSKALRIWEQNILLGICFRTILRIFRTICVRFFNDNYFGFVLTLIFYAVT